MGLLLWLEQNGEETGKLPVLQSMPDSLSGTTTPKICFWLLE
jgi:hypothetical protein